MSSILKVDTIQDQSGNNIINESGNVITIGASGDTITVPAGATVSGFTSAGIDDNATSVAITINSSEQVGIGTTSPASLLDVQGTGVVAAFKSTNNNTVLRLKGSNATNGGGLGSTSSGDLVFLENLSEGMRLTSTGLGIGTSSPKEKLDSRGSAVFSGDHATATNAYGTAHGILLSSTPNLGRITAVSNGANDVKLELRGLDGGSANSNQLVLDGGTSNVGIGTSSPSAKLQVTSASSGGTPHVSADELAIENSANAGINILSGASNEGAIYFGDSGDNDIGRVRYNHSTNAMDFTVNASERMRIDSSGNVGIGTTSPGAELHIYRGDGEGDANLILETGTDSGSVEPGIYLKGYATNSEPSIYFGDRFAYPGAITYDNVDNHLHINTNGSERMRIDSAGAVSIASSNVTQNAHLNVRQDTNGHAVTAYKSATVSSGALDSIKYIRAIPAVSAGTQLIIPFISQNNINSKTYVHVRGISCESNTKDPKAFDCKFAVGHTSTLSNLTVLENLGKCTGASISGMNIVLAFSVDYTHSGDSGMFIELDYIAHHQDASINLSGIVMN